MPCFDKSGIFTLFPKSITFFMTKFLDMARKRPEVSEMMEFAY